MPVAAQTLPPDLLALAKQGLAAKEAGRYEDAALKLEALTQALPDFVPAHLNLGLVRHEQGEFAKAARSFERALELSPSLPDVRPLLGFDLVQAARFVDAIPVLEQARRESPKDPSVAAPLGLAYMREGRLDEALEELQRASTAAPDDPELLRALSELQARRSTLLRSRLLANAPQSAAALHTRAEAAVLGGRLGDATALYQQTLEADPSRPGVRVPLGDLYLEAEDYAAAEGLYHEAARREPGSARAQERWGESLLLLGRGEEAIQPLRTALRIEPERMSASSLLGKALGDLERWAEAESVLQQVLDAAPDNELAARTHYQLAHVCRKLGRAAAARDHLAAYERLTRTQ